MGTRADFYVGTGPDAEWLGSVAWDGYEWSEIDSPLRQAADEQSYRQVVAGIAEERDDWTSPEQGWPWPWENSKTTDFAYAFVDGETKVFEWGEGAEWPDMKDRQNVTLGPRSGVILFRAKKST